MQNGIDSIASVFTAKVTAYRGVSEKKVNADFGQGGVLVGVAAVKAGMADGIGTFESALGLPGASHATAKASAVATAPAALSVEDTCAAQWRSDPQIRAEFLTLETFTAYTRATRAGRAGIVTGRVVSGR